VDEPASRYIFCNPTLSKPQDQPYIIGKGAEKRNLDVSSLRGWISNIKCGVYLLVTPQFSYGTSNVPNLSGLE